MVCPLRLKYFGLLVNLTEHCFVSTFSRNALLCSIDNLPVSSSLTWIDTSRILAKPELHLVLARPACGIPHERVQLTPVGQKGCIFQSTTCLGHCCADLVDSITQWSVIIDLFCPEGCVCRCSSPRAASKDSVEILQFVLQLSGKRHTTQYSKFCVKKIMISQKKLTIVLASKYTVSDVSACPSSFSELALRIRSSCGPLSNAACSDSSFELALDIDDKVMSACFVIYSLAALDLLGDAMGQQYEIITAT